MPDSMEREQGDLGSKGLTPSYLLSDVTNHLSKQTM